MDPDSSRTVALNDYVKSPRGRVVSVTTAATVSASPAENLAVSLDDNRTLTLTSSGGYVGPAAVMLEVTDQDAVDQKDFGTAYVSIPVQVGPKVPLLRCPSTEVTVLAGGLDRVVDIPTYCHAWLPVGMTFDDVQLRDRAGRPRPTPRCPATARAGGGSRCTRMPVRRSSHGRLAVRTEGSAQPVTIGVERRRRRGLRGAARCRRRGCARSRSAGSRRASRAPSTSPATSTRHSPHPACSITAASRRAGQRPHRHAGPGAA